MNRELISRIEREHEKRFGDPPSVLSYAPGRVEVLGNHTDYNEGFVLSSAIDLGIAAAFSPCRERKCNFVSLNTGEEASVRMPVSAPVRNPAWVNYAAGVLAGLDRFAPDRFQGGFNVVFSGDIPMAAGLSSSAAFEIAAALGFRALAGIAIPEMEMAKLCQGAEHDFVGTKCGLLDQISCLFGKADSLVFCDFRSLEIEIDRIGPDVCFLVANTGVKHNLVDSEYNDRRAHCELGRAFFESKLDHPVSALRDVSEDEWKQLENRMDPVVARRSAHVIQENRRVIEGRECLARGDIDGFGRLMFESHESSRINFENSCPELDIIVSEAGMIKSIRGARLSGGGFGGSVVMLVHPSEAADAARIIETRCKPVLGEGGKVLTIKPSDGARVIS